MKAARSELSNEVTWAMKYWGGKVPPPWIREIANDHPRPLAVPDQSVVRPEAGDIVLKPFIDRPTYRQLFRLETWNTHDLLDGPFGNVHEAMDAALEIGVTARLAVWLDYSDEPASHELDSVPLYYADPSASKSESIA